MLFLVRQMKAFDTNIYVVVLKFILGLNFIFLLFLGMAMKDNEFETMQIKFKPRIKLNHNV